MRRRMGRPGLVGTMARTAVIAGTATAVSGRVAGAQQNRAAEAQAQQQAQQDALQSQAEVAEMQQQLAALQAQQGPAAPAPAAAPQFDLIAELQKLASLKDAGVLDEAEFAAAKAKLLA